MNRLPIRVSNQIWLFVALGAVVALLRLGTFDVPPTWDGAMGVWPAAIEISSDWDLPRVLGSPSFLEGGPNTHTLSVITLLSAGLLSLFGPEATYFLLHLVGIGLAAALGVLVARVLRELGHPTLSVWGAFAVASFPLVVSQSAYLYTELPSAFLAFLALILAYDHRSKAAATSIFAATLIKPLAVIAIPAVVSMLWLRGRDLRSAVWPVAAIAAVIPPLLVPQPSIDLDPWSRLVASVGVSTDYFERMPEFIAAVGLPFLVVLIFKVRGATKAEWAWLWTASVLFFCFFAFFLTNGLVTAGWFFLPRYALLLVPVSAVLLFLGLGRLRAWHGIAASTVLLAFFLIGVRGPFAWGHMSPAHPLAERSLAYIVRVDEVRAGLSRLADLSQQMPVYYDHFAHYAYSYPELLYFEGDRPEGVAVFIDDPGGDDLSDFPDRFAMLVGFPFLGGEIMRVIQLMAEQQPEYQVMVETIGSGSPYPLEIVRIERNPG